MHKPTHHVAVALVQQNGRWLVARRPADVHLAGLWEFPGGKLHAGEDAVTAALRELREECAVTAVAESSLPTIRCEYDDRIVLLTPVICRWAAGAPVALGSDECKWVAADELRSLPMPAANQQILRAILKPL